MEPVVTELSARAAESTVQATRKGWGPAILFAVLGVVTVCVSLLPGPGIDDGWARDLLMTIGTSLTLFAPFYLITRSLDNHLDKVVTDTRQEVQDVRTEAAAATAAVQSNFETLQADVEQRLNEFGQGVKDQLDAEVAADSAAFDSLRTETPTYKSVTEALGRAHRLGLTAYGRPPRVDISDREHLYVAVQYDPDEWMSLTLRVEEVNGTIIDSVDWTFDGTATQIMVEVGQMIRRRTGETFDPTRLLVGLADLLDAAASVPERRPAIELCDPQWMVCDGRVVASGRDGHNYPYGLAVEKIRPPNDLGFVFGKNWVDADSFDQARTVALELFPPPGT